MNALLLLPALLVGGSIETPEPEPIPVVEAVGAQEEPRLVDLLATSLQVQGLPPVIASSWAEHFVVYGLQTGRDPFTLAAMAWYESDFNSRAHNPNDPSFGLMAIMPRYWRNGFVSECGSPATSRTLRDPRVNICYGAHIAAFFAAQHPEDERRAITAYNNGSGRLNGYARIIFERRNRLVESINDTPPAVT